jgi:hypothetical protein
MKNQSIKKIKEIKIIRNRKNNYKNINLIQMSNKMMEKHQE